MLKLQQLKKQQQQQQQQSAAPSTAPATESNTLSSSSDNNDSGGSTGFVLKRQSSKELLDTRRQKSKESVLSLKAKTGNKKDGKKTKKNAAELRAHKDISEMEPIPGARVEFPDPDNLMNFNAYITPNDGLYKGAEFKFVLNIPTTYPYDPPKVSCETMVYHPNIDWEGHVCLNILRADWMPVLNLGAVIFGLVTLFLEPNPDDPLNKEAAQLMIDNRSQFDKNVKSALQGGYVAGRQFPKLLR